MRKNTFSLAALTLAVSFCVVFTSCSKQQGVAPDPIVKMQTQYVDKEVERIIGNTLVAQPKKDHIEILFNGKFAMEASVAPDSLTTTLPVAQHTASTIDGDNNRWKDSHGMGFTGFVNQTQLEGLELTAGIMPANPFSDILRIHKYVTMLDGEFNLVGMATLTKTGESKTFSIPVPSGRYFMCDSSVTVRQITNTQIEIQYDTVYVDVVRDSLIEKTITEYVNIDKNAAVINGFGFGKIDFTYGEKSFSFRMDLDSLSILREESGWGVATKVSEDSYGFSLSDLQKGHYTIESNGVKIESVHLKNGIMPVPFKKIDDIQYGEVTVIVTISYENNSSEKITQDFEVSASYLHRLLVKPQTNNDDDPVVIEPSHTYAVDTIRSTVKDSEGNLTGEKMKVTIKRDGETIFKGQYMAKEWGLMTATLTGTQVGSNQQLRATEVTEESYSKDGWSGTSDLKGATLTANAKQFKMRTYFPAVAGFGATEESVAESNIIFGTRSFLWIDTETGWKLTINEGEISVKVTEDFVGTDEAAKAEVNSRGLQYEYAGTHFLSIDQFVGGVKVNSQSRAENLLSPKN